MAFLVAEEILHARLLIGGLCDRANNIKLTNLTEINTESVQIMHKRAIALLFKSAIANQFYYLLTFTNS